AIAVAGGSPPKALVMVVLGLLLADVVARLNDSETQLPIGFNALKGSLNGYVVTIGLIVFSAAIGRLGATWSQATGSPPIPSVMPTWSDLRMPAGPVLRGSAIGTLIGLLPVGALVAPFLAYRIEQSLAKDAARFGSGAIEGVAAPEAANNAGAQAALLPMLTLGLQHNTVLAMLLGTLTISGATPGPQLQMASPEIFWGTIVAFWIGNLMVLAVGLSSVGAWVRLLRLPRRFVLGGLILLGCIWTYSINMSAVDPLLAVVLGFIGYGLAKRGFEPLPIVIGFLLGPQLEEFLSRALMISRGSLMPLLQRPLTTGLLLVAFLVLVMALLSWGREAKKPALTGR